MGSVGRNTVIDYVQTSYTNDDSFEWFGGTVNAKHLVAYRGLDDDMDCDFGYRGQVQYVLVVRDPAIADQSSGSTSEGFECDNDGSGSASTPKTAATFSNVTAIGPLRGNVNATIDPKHERALRLRRNSEMKIHNSIFMDFKKGLFIDGATTEAQATGGNLLFKNNILAGYRPNNGFFKTSASFDIKTFFATNANDSLTSSANILTTPYNYTAPDYRPAVGSLALTGAAFTAAPFAGNVACGLAAPSISGSLSVCQGSSSTLSAPAGFTYLWSNGATTQTINVSAAGSYTVTITDGLGCSNSSTVAVAVNTRPTVTVSGTATVCAGQSVTLTAVGGATYLWNTGVTTNTLTVTPSANTTYSVIGTNVAGCSDTATFSVAVDAIPTMSGTPTITNAGCGLSNGSITGVTVVGTGLTYNWTNSANVSVGTTADLSNVPAGVYNLTATKATGCSAAFGPYSISNPTAPAAATVTVVDSVLCAGETIQMTAASSATGATFTWSGPNFTGSGATVTIPNATAANAGVYSVTVTANGCTSSSSSKSVVVNNLPAVTVLTFTDTTCVNYSSVTLAGAPAGGTFSGSGVNGASFDPAVAGVGTHVVTYAYTDANGCSNTATTSIVVDACVGLGESAINSIRVFPNPTNTVINVASTREDIAVVVLTNSVGEVVARVRGTQLDASQFANGLYFVTAIFEDGSSAVGRVTILN
jgi:hypothetical protein